MDFRKNIFVDRLFVNKFRANFKFNAMKKSVFDYSCFRSGFAWILLILGLIFYWLSFFILKNDTIWKEISIKFADILVIGVILGYLSNAAQFLGIFKSDLQDIITGKEFLNNQKDLTPMWENVSKQMFKEKFPAIHKIFLKSVKGYFPENEISYYNDYEISTTIKWVDQKKGLINVIDITNFELIAESDKKFDFPLKTWTTVRDKNEYQSIIKELLINDGPPLIKENKDFEENGDLCNETTIELEGSTKYKIKHIREKVYNLNDDYYIGFRARYIMNDFRVSLDLPIGLEAKFICRGTPKDFESVKDTQEKKEKKYKGIVFPRQGYIFALKETTT